jgi:hypothetical protein
MLFDSFRRCSLLLNMRYVAKSVEDKKEMDYLRRFR